MNRLVTICRVLFIIATIPVVAVALVGAFASGTSHTIALVWIAMALAMLGNITNWK